MIMHIINTLLNLKNCIAYYINILNYTKMYILLMCEYNLWNICKYFKFYLSR